ncbi:MAG: hypothetical protein WC449_05300 [Candidatus Paceibacterota bacterium]
MYDTNVSYEKNYTGLNENWWTLFLSIGCQTRSLAIPPCSEDQLLSIRDSAKELLEEIDQEFENQCEAGRRDADELASNVQYNAQGIVVDLNEAVAWLNEFVKQSDDETIKDKLNSVFTYIDDAIDALNTITE